MNVSKPDYSLYEVHKKEIQNNRLALDLKSHNWLLQKLITSDSDLTETTVRVWKQLNQNNKMKRQNAQVVPINRMAPKRSPPQLKPSDYSQAKMKKTCSGNNNIFDKNGSNLGDSLETSRSMPDLTEIYIIDKNNREIVKCESQSHQEKSRPPQIEIQLNREASIVGHSKNYSLSATNNKQRNEHSAPVDQQKQGQDCLPAIESKNLPHMKSSDDNNRELTDPQVIGKWCEPQNPIPSRHNFPIPAPPEMKKFRNNCRPPTVLDEPLSLTNKKNSEEQNTSLVVNKGHVTQTEIRDIFLMMQYLHEISIHNVSQLKLALKNEEEDKIMEFLKIKGITTIEKLKELKCVTEEMPGDQRNKVARVIPIDTLVAQSDENKKMINAFLAHAAEISEAKQIKESVSDTNSSSNNQMDYLQTKPGDGRQRMQGSITVAPTVGVTTTKSQTHPSSNNPNVEQPALEQTLEAQRSYNQQDPRCKKLTEHHHGRCHSQLGLRRQHSAYTKHVPFGFYRANTLYEQSSHYDTTGPISHNMGYDNSQTVQHSAYGPSPGNHISPNVAHGPNNHIGANGNHGAYDIMNPNNHTGSYGPVEQQFPATTTDNITVHTGNKQAQYPRAPPTPLSPTYANTMPEALWHSRRWPQT